MVKPPLRTTLLFITVLGLSAWHLSSRMRTVQTGVLRLALVRPCTQTEIENMGDGRTVWVRYLPHNTAFINEFQTATVAVPDRIAETMSTRQERVVWIAGDRRLSYGEFVDDISKLAAKTTAVYGLLSTQSETGPIDPSERRSKPREPTFTFCPVTPFPHTPAFILNDSSKPRTTSH
jgi:biopolymer transport protein ExbD